MMKKVFFFFLFSFPVFTFSQSDYLPLNTDFLSVYDKFFNQKNSNFHSSLKPYINSEASLYADSVSEFTMMPVLRKKIALDTSNKKEGKFDLGISLLFNLEPGYDTKNSTPNFTLEGGFGAHLSYNRKLHAEYKYYGGNSSFLSYQDSSIKYSGIVPGMGAAETSKRGYKYHNSVGYVSYSPNKIFNFQIGKDKNFWGDGYRSLFLSDNAIAYPFFKITTNVWKIKYVSLFAWQKEVGAIPGKTRDKNKLGTFHYLSWNVTKWLNLGFFESIIWQGSDSNRYRGYDVNYLNPLIFFRPVEYSLGSSDNALIGFSFKIKLGRKTQLYSQIIIDEFLLKEIKAQSGWWANKQGLQLGIRFFDMFGAKNLCGRGELNFVRPYTYTHGSIQQNYGNFNQSLAHPLGANFIETIGVLDYRYKNFLFVGKTILAVYGADSAGRNMGHDIFLSYTTRPHDYSNYTTQGSRYLLFIPSIKIAYLILPEINLQVSINIIKRTEVPSLKTMPTYRNNLIFFSLSTALWNEQRDY